MQIFMSGFEVFFFCRSFSHVSTVLWLKQTGLPFTWCVGASWEGVESLRF
jgi:hypothetical protein